MYDYQLILAKSFPAFRRAGFKWIVAYIVTVLLKRTISSDNYELKDDFLTGCFCKKETKQRFFCVLSGLADLKSVVHSPVERSSLVGEL